MKGKVWFCLTRQDCLPRSALSKASVGVVLPNASSLSAGDSFFVRLPCHGSPETQKELQTPTLTGRAHRSIRLTESRTIREETNRSAMARLGTARCGVKSG
jgi:hypothetical protein